MSSPEERMKHKNRLKRKAKEKVLKASTKDLKKRKKMRVITDRHGNEYDLEKMSHRDLVKAIQELDSTYEVSDTSQKWDYEPDLDQ